MAFPQAWEEVCLVTIERFHATTPIVFQAAAITESVDISQGNYPGESIPNIAGGRVWHQSPEEDGEITLEMYPVSLAIDTNTDPDTFDGIFNFFAGGSAGTDSAAGDIDTTTPSQPMRTKTTWGTGVDRTRHRFRVSLLWTDDTGSDGNGMTSAAGATSSVDSVALRFAAVGCRLISHKASFTDGVLKVTATFKFPAMNEDGDVKMWRWESTNDGDTSIMAALPSYTNEDAW